MYNSDESALFALKASKGLCSHAYIIDGADGIGKLEFALFCAKTMLCTGRKKPCGVCESCRKMEDGGHPDVFVVGKDKAASIADVRELIRRSTVKPNDSDKQIFIVNNAGKLRADAQNALLKLFEEPPKTVAMFLLTDSRSSLLPTVLSRGQRIHLDGRRDGELRSILSESHPDASPKDIEKAVVFAGGNLGEGEKYLSKENTNLRAKAENLLVLALTKSNYELAAALLAPKFKREQIHALLGEFATLVNEAQKDNFGAKSYLSLKNPKNAIIIEKASKRALAFMGEYAVVCMIALENNANITAALSRLSIELLVAATK